MSTLHVCLLSEHLLANLIPALQERPNAVLALATPSVQRARLDERFRNICGRAELSCRVLPFEEAGWAAQLGSARRIAAVIGADYGGWRTRLNLTGGTKTMALSMVLGLREIPHEPFYCDTDRGVIETLNVDGAVAVESLRDVLTIQIYLWARGLDLMNPGVDDGSRARHIEQRQDLTRELAQRLPADPEALHFINDVAATALSPGRGGLTQSRPAEDAKPAAWALKLLARRKLMKWSLVNPGRIRLAGQEAAKYAAGGWLEEYVSMGLAACAPHACAADVKVIHQRNREVHNQFDGLVLHRNRMLFIEAKTGRLDKREKDQDVLNKIEALGAFATGKFGSLLLVSARALPSPVLNRAQAFGINVLHGAQILQFKAYVRNWMRGAAFTPRAVSVRKGSSPQTARPRPVAG